MLVWLASYPRSGNTLLRDVLKSCFGLASGDEPGPAGDRPQISAPQHWRASASCPGEGAPEDFYRWALSAPEPVLVKTHHPPRDTEKAIYVVRDGRLVVRSFAAFQDAYHPGTTTPDALIVGDHVYGEWTGHYRAWRARPGETLVVRFEELVGAGPVLLARLGSFLGVPGPVRPWENPHAELRTQDPTFFGPGDRVWVPDAFWTSERLRAFYTLHGQLLTELGYADADQVAAGAYPPGSREEARLRQAFSLAARARELQRVCDERLAEIGRLKCVCDERLAEIEFVTREAEARSELLDAAAKECARLRASVAELNERAGASQA